MTVGDIFYFIRSETVHSAISDLHVCFMYESEFDSNNRHKNKWESVYDKIYIVTGTTSIDSVLGDGGSCYRVITPDGLEVLLPINQAQPVCII